MRKYTDRKRSKIKRISSRRLGAFEHKRSKPPDARKTIRKADREIYKSIPSKENYLNKHHRTRFAK